MDLEPMTADRPRLFDLDHEDLRPIDKTEFRALSIMITAAFVAYAALMGWLVP
jgi:hypothetical protein